MRLTSGERNTESNPLAAVERTQQPLPAAELQRWAGHVRGEQEALVAEPPAPVSCLCIQALENWTVSCKGHNSLVLLTRHAEG